MARLCFYATPIPRASTAFTHLLASLAHPLPHSVFWVFVPIALLATIIFVLELPCWKRRTSGRCRWACVRNQQYRFRKYLLYVVSFTFTGICMTSTAFVGLYVRTCSPISSPADNTTTALFDPSIGDVGNIFSFGSSYHDKNSSTVNNSASTNHSLLADKISNADLDMQCSGLDLTAGLALVTVIIAAVGWPGAIAWFLLKKVGGSVFVFVRQQRIIRRVNRGKCASVKVYVALISVTANGVLHGVPFPSLSCHYS